MRFYRSKLVGGGRTKTVGKKKNRTPEINHKQPDGLRGIICL